MKNAFIFAVVFFIIPTIAFAQVVFPNRGGTGTSVVPALGEVLVGQGDGTYAPVATSTLGITGDAGAPGADGLATTSIDTEAELEAILTNVTDVFTNNDGALDDDDLSDNTTTDLTEGTNLYYTDARVQAELLQGNNATFTAATSTTFAVTGLFNFLGTKITNVGTWFSGLFDTYFAAKDTDDLSEGSTNLYWTDTRFDQRLAATTSLPNINIADGQIPATIARDNELHSAITLSGALDYITLVGQDIVRGAIDLATDITGILGLASGGTGASLVDPNADRIIFWDDSAGATTWLTIGSGIDITGTTLSSTVVGGTGLSTTSIDTEAELEAILSDVTNVFTNNDGALSDDDLSDNSTTDLAEGTNLYWTTTRFDERLAATTSLPNLVNTGSLTVGGSGTSTIYAPSGLINMGSSTLESLLWDYVSSADTVVTRSLSGVTDWIVRGMRFVVENTLEIPNGTACDSNADGEICHDTSDNQLIVDGAVVPTTNVKIWSATIASTSPALLSSGLLKIPTQLDGYTMTAIRCSVQSGTSVVVAVEDESANSTEDITCGTSVTSDDGSITNASVAAAEEMYIDFGATTGAVDYVSVSVFGNWTRE